ncbi:unnamed protein product [Protopolystoma xenopodis]|uniref:Major facilitator superfamily (MFS) profile domain-containing protein n=1 Tax=Protopolystoma xenopodis TaxID=117903 RepID=A0A448W9U9_9PLAT|nr:unnamed protein product [Protopolystoma xenopodis]
METPRQVCCCGPGKKRYLIALLCSLCLTVVIGMRSEMIGILNALNDSFDSPDSQTTEGEVDAIRIQDHLQPQNAGSESQSPSNQTRNASYRRSVTRTHSKSSLGGMAAPTNRRQSSLMGQFVPTDLDAYSSSNFPKSSQQTLVSSKPAKLSFRPGRHRKLPWTEGITEDLIENAVFFAYLIASPIGGYLTVKHDSSLLLGCSVAMTCGMNLFLPLVETIGKNLPVKITIIVLLRLLQGLAEGCLIPAVFGVLRFWGPENERSTLVCLAVIGVSLGPLIGLPVCTLIEKKLGWGVVFYIYANLGLIWCIFWWRLIDEKPSKDKSLSQIERDYLDTHLSSRILNSRRTNVIPWKAIFTSRPIFAIFFTYAADDWTFQISSVCMQSFYRQLYDADVDRTIFLLSFPFLSRSIFVPVGKYFIKHHQLKRSSYTKSQIVIFIDSKNSFVG